GGTGDVFGRRGRRAFAAETIDSHGTLLPQAYERTAIPATEFWSRPHPPGQPSVDVAGGRLGRVVLALEHVRQRGGCPVLRVHLFQNRQVVHVELLSQRERGLEPAVGRAGAGRGRRDARRPEGAGGGTARSLRGAAHGRPDVHRG